MKCVYKLKCRDTTITEFYIGSSVNFDKRKSQHKDNSNNLKNKDYCYPLYIFINVNGGFHNWEFEVIKEFKFITKKELNMNEQYYKELLNPHLNSRNAYGIDKEKKKNTKKIFNKKRGNCPHCNKEMVRTSIKRHIRSKHKDVENN